MNNLAKQLFGIMGAAVLLYIIVKNYKGFAASVNAGANGIGTIGAALDEPTAYLAARARVGKA